MSIFKKTMAITRYKVSGIPEEDGKDAIMLMMESFENNKVIEIPDGEDIAWGWTKLTDPYSPKFNDISFISGDYVTVGMRIDRKNIPAAALKKEIYIAEKKKMEELCVEKLPRALKIMIKESTIKNMLITAPVIPSMFDVVWNVNENILYLLSTSKLARDVIEDLMKESFNLSIEMIFPFTMGEKSISESDLFNLTQTNFI